MVKNLLCVAAQQVQEILSVVTGIDVWPNRLIGDVQDFSSFFQVGCYGLEFVFQGTAFLFLGACEPYVLKFS